MSTTHYFQKEISTDIFGSAIKDYFEDNFPEDILVHSSISTGEVIPVEQLFREEDKLPELEKIALENCRGKVLDVGAGAGAHTLILQKKKIAVTALDISPTAVEIMKKRGVKNAGCESFFKFDNGKFDTLLFLMNGLGIAGSLEGLEKLLTKAKSLLNPGGIILADSTDILYMFMEEDGSALIPLDHYYGEVEYQLEYKGQLGVKFEWLFIDYPNLESYARKYGFSTELVYTDEDDSYLVKLTLQ